MPAPYESSTGTVGSCQYSVGRFTYGFSNVHIKDYGASARLIIGSFCSLATGITVITGGNHQFRWATNYPFGYIFENELTREKVPDIAYSKGDVTIGSDVWIGHGVTIMSGVSIGHGAVIAANSHVVKDVRPYSIVGGNPAEWVKNRFEPFRVRMLLELAWWDLPLEDIRSLSRELCQEPSSAMIQGWLDRFREVPRTPGL